jgi:hypothetical protein
MLYCDNKAAINIANNPIQHDQTKHVEIDHHFIKEKLDNGEICLPFVRTTEQLADVFTKGLHTAKFSNIICKMNMKNIYSFTKGLHTAKFSNIICKMNMKNIYSLS